MRQPKRISHYVHEAAPSTQVPDDAVGSYYVTIKRGERIGLLLGPYFRHAEAIAMVPAANRKAQELDPPGKLNDLMEASA